MEKSGEQLIKDAKHNLEVAKEQLEKLGDNEDTDESTKPLLQQNYENAKKNLQIITNLFGGEEESSDEVATKATPSQNMLNQPVRGTGGNSNDLVLPSRDSNSNVTVHFPTLGEVKSEPAINRSEASKELKPTMVSEDHEESVEPTVELPKKFSTGQILREAARQTFFGNRKKHPTADNETGMTREEYRRRYNK